MVVSITIDVVVDVPGANVVGSGVSVLGATVVAIVVAVVGNGASVSAEPSSPPQAAVPNNAVTMPIVSKMRFAMSLVCPLGQTNPRIRGVFDPNSVGE